ncbi:MAG: hypothetical protein CM15mP46_4000 [Alphaproteobacteria bacterium]|nr:MAG: hypothetical protein CM15mP46_4000 [Alphaproteobacteria bacterium]
MHYDLQETLARRILTLAGFARGCRLSVRTAKPEAYDDCQQIAYELE